MIEFYFLLPDFKSRGQPTCESHGATTIKIYQKYFADFVISGYSTEDVIPFINASGPDLGKKNEADNFISCLWQKFQGCSEFDSKTFRSLVMVFDHFSTSEYYAIGMQHMGHMIYVTKLIAYGSYDTVCDYILYMICW